MLSVSYWNSLLFIVIGALNIVNAKYKLFKKKLAFFQHLTTVDCNLLSESTVAI